MPEKPWLCSSCRKELADKAIDALQHVAEEETAEEETADAISPLQSLQSLTDYFDDDYAPTSSQKRTLDTIDVSLGLSPIKRKK